MRNFDKLNLLGWNDYFKRDISDDNSNSIGRVVTVDRELFIISTGVTTLKVKLSGKFIYNTRDNTDYPCLGDWVLFNKKAEDDLGVIQSVIKRKTVMSRKIAGNKSDVQLIAVNVDYVIIVQSCHYDFNIKRLERYLVMASDGGAEPFIVLTKTDLVTSEELDSIKKKIDMVGIKAPVKTISSINGTGINEFRKIFLPGKTYCFVGSSGVGKSTLINILTGKVRQFTQSVSNTGEGRHTTVRRELIRLDCGALIIDNPGMRELGLLNAEDGMAVSYSDVEEIAGYCKFKNCTHTSEPGCAVIESLNTGKLDKVHFNNYLKLKSESEFNSMSYFEKRQKERRFGKYVKTVKNDIKRRKNWR